ncbi:MAG: DUF1353 domain-containing protein [bacterium]|nr:DUF1353 domain-containing protein [bacterium]
MKKYSAAFPKQLDMRTLPSGKEWMLLKDFSYHHPKVIINVPKGFITDIASIPRLAHPLITKNGPWTFSAVIHDFLYAVEFSDQKTCDDIFLDAMIEWGVTWHRRNIIYSAVRTFGRIVWNKHDKKEVDRLRKIYNNNIILKP